MRTTILFSACILVLSAAACGSVESANRAPTIDAVTVTNSPVTASADGTYTVDISMNVSDVVDVDTYNFDSTAAKAHLVGPIPPTASGTARITVTLASSTATGTVDFDISVVDVSKMVSNQVAGSVLLEGGGW